MAIATKIRINI